MFKLYLDKFNIFKASSNPLFSFLKHTFAAFVLIFFIQFNHL